MTVEPLVPDAAPVLTPAPDTAAFGKALDAFGGLFESAQEAEDRFASGGGRLYEAVYERARADVALAVATATAQRAGQAVSSILNMQV